jgi:hypothetical protein
MTATEKLDGAAKALARAVQELPDPSDTTDLLALLSSAQSTMNEVYGRLAEWHLEFIRSRTGNEHEPEGPAWIRAEMALQEAAQYARDAAAALDRARVANEVGLWADELKFDEGV